VKCDNICTQQKSKCNNKGELMTLYSNLNVKSEPIKFPIAVLLLYTMHADGKITEKETKHIYKIFGKEFGMDEVETDDLFNVIAQEIPDLGDAVKEIRDTLRNDAAEKAKIMVYVNNLIGVDGIKDIEYRLFEQVRDVLF